jgi:predicted RNA-binding Zn-ribbon protein involved in translation (DUF1610 family)
MEYYICPQCGKRSMEKKEIAPEKYTFICSKCGFQHQTLHKDEKKRGFL